MNQEHNQLLKINLNLEKQVQKQCEDKQNLNLRLQIMQEENEKLKGENDKLMLFVAELNQIKHDQLIIINEYRNQF